MRKEKAYICVFVALFLNCYTTRGNIEKIDIHMPGVRPKKNDSYICTTLKLPPGDSFIVKYEPNAHKETAHHMLLFGCERPGRFNSKAWNCGDMGSGTCTGSESILFGWARDAAALQLPKDVGFKVGGNTEIQYLTLQIHYAHALEAKHYDRSGLTLHVKTTPQLNLASIYLLVASSAYIPPNSKGIHVDIACEYNSEQEINAFAFRTHAHDLGRVITAYRVRNNTWKLLGKGDPHAPQAFYPMENVTTIRKGDILAARCTYDTINTGRTHVTRIGSTASDEMCNFYMMYYRDASSNIETPEICAEQYTYASLYDSFPNGSDVALHSSSGHHHHHHHGHQSNLEGDDVTGNDVADRNNVPTGSDVNWNVADVGPTVQTTNYQESQESTNENPTAATTQPSHAKTPRSVTHDVISDVKTSTSVSEQTTRSSDFVEDKSTRLDFRVSTKNGPRTTASSKELKSSQSSLELKTSENNDSVIFNVYVVDAWPSAVAEGLGQVTGLAVDSTGRLFVFHRSERIWDYNTFNDDNSFRNPKIRGPISGSTIWILDGSSGAVLGKHGENMFYLPHGLTIDHQNNLWLTDVGRHQVMKFPPGEFEKPSLVLGENLVPGSGYKHFCKPTDVAVEKSGIFYVADGYCNGRIMKFSAEGGLMKVWGRPSLQDPLPGTFNLPHSLALDTKRNMLYVADRENGRIQCFDTEGKFHKEITSPKFGGLVFAVDFNSQDDVLYAVNSGGEVKVQGFTINPNAGNIIASWSPHGQGFSQPHAVVSNGSSIYVAEIGPNRVWKFEHPSPVTSKDPNFARELNAAVLPPNNPTQDSDDTYTDKHDNSRKKAEVSNRPGLIILGILSVPVLILLVVGVVSRVTRRNHSLPKYDMMDASLGNYSVPRDWCNSMNCCNRQYRNMEELYLMDSDSDLEIYPDVHKGRK